jgi:NAD(P)-dependent dehydrogenase (short-subunit alcohol dehydrogenase family)
MSGLKDKVVVITGGGGVLCRAIAVGLGAAGARVAIVNRTAEKGEAAADAVRHAGGRAVAISCDVLQVDSLKSAKARVEAEFGGCDILINGAGGNNPAATTSGELFQAGQTGGFFDLTEAGFRAVFDLNFVGTLLPIQVFAKDMVGRPGASILNISSMASFSPMTKVPAYAAAKAAVNNFTSWLAVHFAESGIRVNALAPGFFSTEQNKHLLWNPDGSPSPRTAKILAHTPMRRLGVPEDLIGPTLWLCDPDASAFVTGVVLPVDGGFQAYAGV